MLVIVPNAASCRAISGMEKCGVLVTLKTFQPELGVNVFEPGGLWREASRFWTLGPRTVVNVRRTFPNV